jgi:hypothetical protein
MEGQQWLGAGISMLGGAFGAQGQQRRQRELMNLQHQNQQELNQQGHDLQYQQWLRTNYPAQVEMMKKAGLNPALMYKGSGPGGTTGSQTGGSAASGSAVAFSPMDVSNMALMKAQKDAIEEGIEKSKWERGAKGDQDIAESVARALESGQKLSESKQRELNLKTENEIKQHDRDYLKKHGMSTYDVGIIRAIKAVMGGIKDAMNWYEENKGLLENNKEGTGKPLGNGKFEYREGYIWNDRAKRWIQI